MDTLYLECYSGISGDMTVAALLDLGANREVLLKGLESLQIDGYQVSISNTTKNEISAVKFDVLLESNHHEELKEHSHHHIHRNLHDIIGIISNSNITENAKRISCKIFHVVAQAEAKVHGRRIEEVHFHEVGAIDSIIDIVATGICIDNLGIQNVIISPIYEGTGHVKCQHGIIPVPVSAVLEIFSQYELELKITQNIGEMITPTGAAIAAALKTMKCLPENYRIKKIGVGAGTKDFLQANVLRAILVEPGSRDDQNYFEDEVIILQCNIDDMTGEEMGYSLEVLLEEGALDAFFMPIFMKKNRPAYLFSVICKSADCNRMEQLIFNHTSTLGIRRQNCERRVMHRDFKTFESSLGCVKIKKASYENINKDSLEYEDIRAIAKREHLSIREVVKKIMSEMSSDLLNF